MALCQVGEQDDECLGLRLRPSACIQYRRTPCRRWNTGVSARDASRLPDVRATHRWWIRFIKDPPFGSAYLTNDDLGEYANHHAFLSLPSWEIAARLSDTAQI